MSKRVAVIGAGASGLCAIKSCIEEGLEPVCYEKQNYMGGLWQFTQEVQEGQSCVMKSTVINTSKELMAYSDYPVPDEYPLFMHNTMVIEYIKLYAEKFGLEKYIKYQHETTSVKQADDFAKTGRWVLEVKNTKTNETTKEVFDGVIVCTGHHADKRYPKFPGLDTFQGETIHTHDYRDHVGYEGKRVVIIGIGNSGGDVAVELSRVSDQVFLSTRRGSWVLNRISYFGYPYDLLLIRRVIDTIHSIIPVSLFNSIVEFILNHRFNHENYNLKPKHRFDAQHPMVNDELPNRIASGTVIISPDIKRINPTSVEFVDGSVAENVDVIIFATGYTFGFPFLNHPGLAVKDNEVNLYSFMYPPDVKPHTLAVVGCIQPFGAIVPIAEMQSRLAARVIAGKAKLPSSDVMWADIRRRRAEMRERYADSPRHTIQVDYVEIMDQVAELVGCKPDLKKLFWTDPLLWKEVFLGSFVPYHYRLMGPHAWSGARDAIMTIWDRTVSGTTRTRKVTKSKSYILYIIVALSFAILIRWFINTFG